MRLAYFDCSYGIAGDMILGALVDAGAPFAQLKGQIEVGLRLPGIRLIRRRVERAGVVGTRVLVRVEPAKDRHRRLSEIEDIIRRTAFSTEVKDRCIAAFRRLARAEAKVHRTTSHHVRFHEVGCLDAIADVAGAMLSLEALGVERVEASRVVAGSGSARSAHGVLPVPGPATVELLRGVPFETGPFPMEMATPTGAAVLTTIASAFGPQPLLTLECAGYGAGDRTIEGHANFLRVLIGQSSAVSETPPSAAGGSLLSSRLNMLMTEIDDMNPELLGNLMERLFRSGCLDAHFTAVQMKKNRPGTQIQVLCRPDQTRPLTELILRHTSTFGLKIMEIDRVCLPRRVETIQTQLGPLDVKIGLWGDEVLKVTPEYESCRRLAESAGLSLAEVYRLAEARIQARYFAARGRKKRKGA